MEPIKVSMVSPSEIKNGQNSSVLEQGTMSVNAIPDLDVLTGHVYEILEFLERPATSSLLKSNEGAVKMMLNQKYADTVPLPIITLLLEEDLRVENVEKLLNLFERLAKVKKIKNEDEALKVLEKTQEEFTQENRKQYKIEEFEKELEKQANEKKTKVKYTQ
jgi:hypothetical protein